MRPLLLTNRLVSAAVPGRASAALVWGVWLACLAGALLYVARFGHAIPYLDDYAIVPLLTGERPVNLDWLWEQHNEHRIPLPKLLLLTLLHLSGGDFRAGMYASVLSLGALAAFMICAAQRLRGWTSPADAFFPLVLLHWGNSDNFLWGWQITIILPTAFAGAYVALLAGRGARLNAVALPAAGFGLLLLALSGPPGLAYVPLLTLWLGYSGVRCWRRGPGRRRAAVLLAWALAAGACCVLAVYFVGYLPMKYLTDEGDPVTRDVRSVVRTTLQYLSQGVGHLARPTWPFSGLTALGLGVLSVAVLLSAFVRQPRERVRAAGLLALLGGAAALAMTIGWSRAGNYTAGFVQRYATFTAPALCCFFFTWELYGPRSLRQWVRAGFLAFAGLVFVFNLSEGLKFGRQRSRPMAAFERDIFAGAPLYELVSRHYSTFQDDSRVFFDYQIRALAQAGVEPFRRLREVPLREVPLALSPGEGDRITPAGGPDAYLEYALPQPAFLAGIRITYSHDRGDGGSPFLRMSWKRDDRDPFPAEPPYREWDVPTGEDQTLTLWIADTVSAFRLYPNQAPGDFRVAEVVLLKPLPD